MTTERQDVGRVDRVVIDPRNRMPSHLVVCRGGLFATDRVLPIDWVSEAQENVLLVRFDPQELDVLPTFEDSSYVAGEQVDGIRSKDRGQYALPYYYYPAVSTERTVAAFFTQMHTGRDVPWRLGKKTWPAARTPTLVPELSRAMASTSATSKP